MLAALDLEDDGALVIEDARNLSYKAPDVGYADDLVSNTGALRYLQAKADLISACTMILGLSIASHKLRAYSGITQYTPSKAELKHIVAIARTQRASPDMLRAVFQSSLLNKVAYWGVLSGRSLEESLRLDSILAAEYLRRSKD